METNEANTKKSRRPRSMYIQIILYGLVLAIIPALILGTTVYERVNANLEKQNNDYTLTLLKNLQHDVDGTLNSLMYESLYLSLDRDVKFFTNYPFESDWYRLTAVHQNILDKVTANDNIDSIYTYYPNTGQLVSAGGSYRAAKFYDLGWYTATRERTDSSSAMIMLPARIIREDTGAALPEEKRVVSFVTLISGYGDRVTGGVAVNVDSLYLEELLARGSHADSRAVVFDSGENVFLSTDPSFYGSSADELFPDMSLDTEGYFTGQLDGEKVMISHTDSPQSGMRYVSIIPYDSFTESYSFIRWTIVLTCTIALAAGTIFALCFARRIYKPVRRMVSAVAGSDAAMTEPEGYKDSREVDFVRQRYRNVLMESYRHREMNDLLKVQVRASKEALTNGYIHDLISGAAVDMDEVDKKMQALEMPAGRYMLMLIAIDGYAAFSRTWTLKEQSRWRGTVAGIAEGVVGSHGWCVAQEHGSREVLLLCHAPARTKRAALEAAAADAGEICATVGELLGHFTVSIACGSICDDISCLADGYQSARAALENRWLSGGGRVFTAPESGCPSGDAPVGNVSVGKAGSSAGATVYFEDVEREIVAALKAADSDRCFQLLEEGTDRIVRANDGVIHRSFSALYKLIDSLCRYLESLNYKSEHFPLLGDASRSVRLYELLSGMETLEDIKSWTVDLLGEALAYLTEKYDKRSTKLVQQIQQYIDQNYSEDLYLKGVASTFGISEYYLSRLFRQEVGLGFSEYLTALRIDQAKKLLLETPENSVTQIALDVGYSGVQTFVRVFKKREGVTPRQFRQRMQGK